MMAVSATNALWAIGFGANCALLAVLIAKRRWRIPVFVAMIANQVLGSAILFVVSFLASTSAYFWFYWVLAGPNYALQIAVIGEIVFTVLRPRGKWIEGATAAFLMWAGLGSAIAMGLVLLFRFAPTADYGWEARVSVFTSLLTCELFLALSLAANRLHLQRRDHVKAIGQGLTAWAIVALVGDVASTMIRSAQASLISSRIRMAVYILVVLFWTKALARDEQEKQRISPQDTSALNERYARRL